MKRQCLPHSWIVLKVCVALWVMTSVLYLCTDLYAAANSRETRTDLQRWLFVSLVQQFGQR